MGFDSHDQKRFRPDGGGHHHRGGGRGDGYRGGCDGGGRRGGYGGGRGGRGGRGGGGRQKDHYDGPRGADAYSLTVRTNHFLLKLKDPSLKIYQYEAVIKDATLKTQMDVNGDEMRNKNGRLIKYYELMTPRRGKTENQMILDVEKANALSQRILEKLIKNEFTKADRCMVVQDGSRNLYSAHRLFGKNDDEIAQLKKEGPEIVEAGTYGPGDTGGHFVRGGASQGNARRYFVTVPKDCDENDPDANVRGVRRAHYAVELMERGMVEISSEEGNVLRLQQALNTMLKCNMIRNLRLMNAPGKNPNRFYLSDYGNHEEERVLGSSLVRAWQEQDRRFRDHAPHIGLSQRVIVGEGLKLFEEASPVAKFFHREFHYCDPRKRLGSPPRRVMLLNDDGSGRPSIAGVYISSTRQPLDDGTLRQIEANIRSKIGTFHIEYIDQSPEKIQKLKELQAKDNWPEDQVMAKLKRVRKNKKLVPDGSRGGISIFRSASELKFKKESRPQRRGQYADQKDGQEQPQREEAAEGEETTVAEYFLKRYNIRLIYPEMPVIFIGKNEWYPIEFAYYALTPAKGANDSHDVQTILGLYDEIGGKRYVEKVCDLEQLFEKMNPMAEETFKSFSLEREREPLQLRAKVLEEPVLKFRSHSATISNGDWSLKNAHFAEPSELLSFAVIDFTGHIRGKPDSNQFMCALLNSMKGHGMVLPRNIDSRAILDNVTRHARDTENIHEVYEAFQDAIAMAERTFLHDNQRIFSKSRVWHKTRCNHPKTGQLADCLVLSVNQETNQVALMLPSDIEPTTHMVKRKNAERGEPWHKVRLMVHVAGIPDFVDPFDVDFGTQGGHVEQYRYVHVKDNKLNRTLTLGEDEVLEAAPFVNIDMQYVWHHPSMIFVYLPDDATSVYQIIKMMSHFESGTTTQCAVQAKYANQRGWQYCSNLALKVNAKLSCSGGVGEGRAWITQSTLPGEMPITGIPWVSEVPTLVLGLDVSQGLGAHSISVIAATVALDRYCMRFAHTVRCHTKLPVIVPEVFEEIIRTCYNHFLKANNGLKPERVLYFRGGVSEGQFVDVFMREVMGIRKVIHDIKREINPKFECRNPNCGKDAKAEMTGGKGASLGKGCVYCTPPITAVVCQTQHNIRIVPDRNDMSCNNVPSGTTVDKTIMSIENYQKPATKDVPREYWRKDGKRTLFEVDDEGFDFLLVAQGGLKGTSKPIYYRTLLNENAVWKTSSKATPLTRNMLQRLTYHMSFQYGTATKSTRKVPVIYYSDRLANMVMGYINFLRGQRGGNGGSMLATQSLEDESLAGIRRPRERDGTEIEIQKYIRNDLLDKIQHPKFPKGYATELLHGDFTPYNPGIERPAYFPHISA